MIIDVAKSHNNYFYLFFGRQLLKGNINVNRGVKCRIAIPVLLSVH